MRTGQLQLAKGFMTKNVIYSSTFHFAIPPGYSGNTDDSTVVIVDYATITTNNPPPYTCPTSLNSSPVIKRAGGDTSDVLVRLEQSVSVSLMTSIDKNFIVQFGTVNGTSFGTLSQGTYLRACV